MYKGYDAWQCPPNGPGITMLVMLNILSHFDLTKFAPLSVERFHIEAEAARVAYMMREQRVGDPAFANVDVAGILKSYADEYVAKIRMDRMLDLPKVSPPMNPSTVYITVVDKDRKPAVARIGSARDADLLHDNRLPIVKHDEIVVLHFRDPKTEKPLGVLVQWNCHPETLGSKNTACPRSWSAATFLLSVFQRTQTDYT